MLEKPNKQVPLAGRGLDSSKKEEEEGGTGAGVELLAYSFRLSLG